MRSLRHLLLAAGAVVLLAPAAAQAAPPANDDLANAIDLGSVPSQVVDGTNVDATAEPQEGSLVFTSVWYRWTPTANGTLTLDTCSPQTTFDTLLTVFTGTTYGSLVPIAADDDSCAFSGPSKLSFAFTAGTAYSFRVEGFGAASGSFRLRLAASLTTPSLSLTSAPPALLGGPGGISPVTSDTDFLGGFTLSASSPGSQAHLTARDKNTGATHGHLVNGSFSLADPLEITATGPAGYQPLDATAPVELGLFGGAASPETVNVGLRQTVQGGEALRSGTYAMDLELTLSQVGP